MKIILLNICFVFLSFSVHSQSMLNYIDSLKKLPDDTVKIKLINDFIWENKFKGINDTIVNLGLFNKERALSIDDYAGVGTSLKNTAAIFYYGGDYSSAIEFYEKALPFFQKAKDLKGIAIINQNLGNVFFQQASYKQALEYYFRSLTKYEEINYSKGITGIYDALGNVYKSNKGRGDLEKALDYYKKSFEIKKQSGNELSLISSYLHIGDIFLTQAVGSEIIYADSALSYFREAERIAKKHGLLKYIGILSDGLGSVFQVKNEKDSAYFYYQKSLQLKLKMQNIFGVISTKKYLAEYFMSINLEDSALHYYEDAIVDAKKIEAGQIVHDISFILANIYNKKEKYKEASKLFSRYIILHDSLKNDEATKHMAKLELKYEFEKQEKIKEEEIKRQKLISRVAMGGLLFMLLMAIIIFKSYQAKKRANQLLEEKNDEIEKQNDEIEKKNESLTKQRDTIAEQNKNIKDSILYAQKIQQAVLPPESYLKDYMKDYFILFKPRDIVSGDYYWVKQKNDKLIITAADCTGHGVPGAFMSLLGMSFLNEIISLLDDEQINAASILDLLREKVKNSLRQTGKAEEAKDGMDMALCVIDKKKTSLSFSGANNPLLVIRNNEFIEYKPDKMPVGIYVTEKENNFSNNLMEIQANDKFYLFSDGYVDQFGGDKGRKFMSKRFKSMLLEINDKSFREQKEILDKTIEDWKKTGNEKQVDDILVMGFQCL